MNTYSNKQFIHIEELKVFAHHGVFEEETINGQDFYITAKLYTDLSKAGISDDLDDSTDYGSVCQLITSAMKEKTFKLIEAAAEYVASKVLTSFPLIKGIDLTLSKPHAPVPLPFKNISVNISKSWHNSIIALGSNMGNKELFIENAINAFNEDSKCIIKKISDMIITPPYGYTDQEDFLNGALIIETLYSPLQLLEFIHNIENSQGRKREIHWGPRTLDLDILFYDDLILETDDLIIPHPEIEKRDFVITPLKQISPYKIHPLLNKRICDL